ncbi:MAG: hypothetical protein H0U92_07150 [Actinobacteria bacterium]|nr:hypothetical protein [Actinomycetota bacterium]
MTPSRSCRVAIAAIAVAATAGGGKDSTEGKSVEAPGSPVACTPPSSVAPDAVPASLAAGLRPAPPDIVTSASSSNGNVVLEASSSASVNEVFERYKSALVAAGFTVDDEDNEGREAELFFSSGGRKGSLLIARRNCPPGSTGYKLTVPAQ